MDNIPIICAAGKVEKGKDTVQQLITIYKDYDAAEDFINNINRNRKLNSKTKSNASVKCIGQNNKDENVKFLVEPLLRKFRFKIFEEEFFEDLYYQSRRLPLGKSENIHSKPDDITNTNRTFGRITKRSPYPVIPNTGYSEIMNESLKGHRNYIISHNSYYPSEKLNRNYFQNDSSSSYNPNSTFGKKTNPDISGGNIKRILKSCDDNFCIINTIQDNKLKNEHFVLSKPKTKQNLNLDTYYTCGHPPRDDKVDGKMLLQNLPSCPKLLQLFKSISYINAKRIKLKKTDFAFHEVEIALKSYDESGKGYLPWDLVFRIMHQHHLLLNKDKIKPAIVYFKISDAKSENIIYGKFLKLLMATYPLPQLTNLYKLPETDSSLLTTYREFTSDRCRYPICKTAFTKDDFALNYPKVPDGQSQVDLAHLGYETCVGSLLSPSTATQYGLSYRDYLVPRTEEEIQQIFKGLLNDIDEKQFLDIWNEAKTLITSKCDLVSIEAFKFALNKFNAIKK